MKKIHSSTNQKSGYIYLSLKGLLFACFFIVLLGACNSKSTNTSSIKVDTASIINNFLKVEADQPPFTLHHYILTVDQQKNLFFKNDVKDIRFMFKKIAGDDYTLTAIGVSRDGDLESGFYDLTAVPGTDTIFSKQAKRDEQQIIRGGFKMLYKLLAERGKDTEIDPKHFKELRLIPAPYLHGYRNSVQFIVTTNESYRAEQNTFNGTWIISNPSPPAKPCDTTCDE